MNISIIPFCRKRTLAVLFVGIIAVSSLMTFFAIHTSDTRILGCVDGTCSARTITTARSVDLSQIENLNLIMRIGQSNSSFNLSPVPGNRVFRQITFSRTGTGQLLLKIPMRIGTNTNFGVPIPNLLNGDSILVRIISSKELYLFVNSKIAYSHRYSAPVFMVDPVAPVDFTTVKSIGKYSLSTSRYSAEISVEDPGRLRLLEFGFVLIGILVALLIRKLLWRVFQGQKAVYWFDFPIALPVYLWLISVGLWLIRNPDATGATNPSPFAPVGAAFSDYFQVVQVGQQSHPYDLGASNYPPLTLLIGRAFSFIPNMVSFVILFSISAGAILLLQDLIPTSSKRYARVGRWMFIGLSYPLVFAIVRGNFDLIAAALVFIGFLSVMRNSTIISTVSFSLAIAFKYWPVFFLLILIKQGKGRIALYSILGAGLVTAISLMCLGYPPNLDGLHILLTSLTSANSGHSDELGYSFSFRTLIYFVHILVTAYNPFLPSQDEATRSFKFVDSLEGTILVLVLGCYLLWLLLRARSLSSAYLYACAFVLLIPSPTYTYRGIVLMFFIYLRALESGKNVATKSRKDRHKRSINEFRISPLFPTKMHIWLWLIIIAPTTLLYVRDTIISTASLLQPSAVLILVYLEKKRENASNLQPTPEVAEGKTRGKFLAQFPS